LCKDPAGPRIADSGLADSCRHKNTETWSRWQISHPDP
jgi:hypothetical protein